VKSPFERVWNWRNRKKVREFVILPSGKRLHSYGKSPCLMGKSTINGPFPSSLFWHNQRVSCLSSCFPVKKMLSCHCRGPFFPISRPSGSALVQGPQDGRGLGEVHPIRASTWEYDIPARLGPWGKPLVVRGMPSFWENDDWLVVLFHHLEKWWSSSMGRIIPYIVENNPNVWNHQPDENDPIWKWIKTHLSPFSNLGFEGNS